MDDGVAAVVERLARLELALADERQARTEAAREAAESAAALRQALDRVGRDLADGLSRLGAGLQAAAERQAEADKGLDAARTWLSDLTRHLAAAQEEANGWAKAEQEARTALEGSVWELRGRQAAADADAAERPLRERALRAEVTALGRLADDLAAAVFPPPDGRPG